MENISKLIVYFGCFYIVYLLLHKSSNDVTYMCVNIPLKIWKNSLTFIKKRKTQRNFKYKIIRRKILKVLRLS